MHACPRQQRTLACCFSHGRWKPSLRRALALLVFFALSQVAARAELLSGEITQDKTLSGTNTVQGTVIVRPGVALTIAPGTTMLMKAAAGLQINGRLIAEGTASSPI